MGSIHGVCYEPAAGDPAGLLKVGQGKSRPPILRLLEGHERGRSAPDPETRRWVVSFERSRFWVATERGKALLLAWHGTPEPRGLAPLREALAGAEYERRSTGRPNPSGGIASDAESWDGGWLLTLGDLSCTTDFASESVLHRNGWEADRIIPILQPPGLPPALLEAWCLATCAATLLGGRVVLLGEGGAEVNDVR